MKTIKIELTPEQLRVLTEHWGRNINYGVNGTFGDGERLDDSDEYKTADAIMEILFKAKK